MKIFVYTFDQIKNLLNGLHYVVAFKFSQETDLLLVTQNNTARHTFNFLANNLLVVNFARYPKKSAGILCGCVPELSLGHNACLVTFVYIVPLKPFIHSLVNEYM